MAVNAYEIYMAIGLELIAPDLVLSFCLYKGKTRDTINELCVIVILHSNPKFSKLVNVLSMFSLFSLISK